MTCLSLEVTTVFFSHSQKKKTRDQNATIRFFMPSGWTIHSVGRGENIIKHSGQWGRHRHPRCFMKPLCGTKHLDILNLTRGKVCVGKASMISVRCHKLARTTDIQNGYRARTHDTRPSLNLLQHKQHLCKIWKILLCHSKCKQIINSSNYFPYINTSNVSGMLEAKLTDPYTNSTFQS
jgi:hypothetical protein